MVRSDHFGEPPQESALRRMATSLRQKMQRKLPHRSETRSATNPLWESENNGHRNGGALSGIAMWRRREPTSTELEVRQSDNPAWDREDMFKVRMDDVDQENPYEGKRCGKVRHLCCGTRKRRFGCLTFAVLVLGLLSFLGYRASQAIQIANSSPKFSKVSINSLCANEFSFDIEGSIDNPSAVGATLQEAKSAVTTEDGTIGFLKTPEFEVPSGTSQMEVTGVFEICDDCVAPLRKAIQKWFDGSRVDYTIDMELTAKFGASVFLVPVSFSTALKFDNFLDSYFDPSLTYEEREALALEAAKRGDSLLGSIALVSADEKTVQVGMGVNLTSPEPDAETIRKFEEEGFGNYEVLVDMPPLGFRALVNGEQVAVGSSSNFVFGSKKLLQATAAFSWDSVPAVNKALDQYFSQETIPFALVGDKAHAPKASECFLQDLLEGVQISNKVEFFESVTKYQEELSKNDPALVQLESFGVTALDKDGKATLDTTLNLLGTQAFYKFEGELPPFQVDLLVNSSSVEARERVGTLALLEKLPVTQDMAPIVDDVQVQLDLDNATLITQVVEQVSGLAGGDFTPYLFASASPSTLLGALVQNLIISFPLNGDDDSGFTIITRGRQLSSAFSRPGAQVGFDVEEDFMQLDLYLPAITKDDLFGYDFVLSETNVSLSTVPFGNTADVSQRFFSVFISEIDLKANQAVDVSVSVRLFDENYNGAFLIDLVERFFELYQTIQLDVSGSYSQETFLSQGNMLRKADWKSMRPDAFGGGQDAGISTGDQLLNLAHFEMKSLKDNEIQIGTAFAINIQNLAVDVTVPGLALGVANCNDPADQLPILNIETTPIRIDLGSDNSTEFTDLDVSLNFDETKSTDILQAVSTVFNGDNLKVCIIPHPNPTKADFLSKLIAAFNFEFDTGSLSGDETSSPGDSILTLDIVDDATSVCTSAEIDLSETSANWTSSIGWGSFEINVNNAETSTEFLSVRANEAFFGASGCQSPFATTTSCATKSASFTFCISTESADIAAGAAAAAKSLRTVAIDENPLQVSLGGFFQDRRATTSQTPIKADFTIPEKAVSALQGVSAGNSTSSFLDQLHAEFTGLVSDEFRLDMWLGLSLSEGSKTILSFPALALGVAECGNAQSPAHLLSITTSAANTALDLSRFALAISMADTNKDKLLDTIASFSSGELLKLCIKEHPNSALGKFLSKLIVGFALDFEFGGETGASTTPPALSFSDLDIVVSERSACADVQVNLDSFKLGEGFSLGWGDIVWEFEDASQSETFFALTVGQSLVGDQCGSQFSTDASCGRKSLRVPLCLKTSNPSIDQGAAAVGRTLKNLIVDQIEQPIRISGSTTNRLSGSPVETSTDFVLPANALDKLQDGASFAGSGPTFAFEDSHVEFFGLRPDSVLGFGAAFKIPNGDSPALTLALPTLALGISDCSDASNPTYILSVIVQTSSGLFSTASNDMNVMSLDVDLSSSNSAKVVDVAAKVLNGTPTKLCLAQSQVSVPANFLSKVLAGVEYSFQVNDPASASDSGDSTVAPTVLDLQITEEDAKVCVTAPVDLSRFTSDSASFSLGWGQNQLVFGDASKTTGGQFLSLKLAKGYIQGACDSPFADSACDSPMQFQACATTDNADLANGAELVYAMLNKVFVEEESVTIRLDSSAAGRLEKTSLSATASFSLPTKAFSTVFGSTDDPSTAAGTSVKHVEFTALQNDQVRLLSSVTTDFKVEGFTIKTTVPKIAVSVSDCAGSTRKIITTVETSSTAIQIAGDAATSLTSLEIGLALGFDGAASTDVLAAMEGFTSGAAQKFCVGLPPAGSKTTFLTRLINAFDFTYESTASTDQTSNALDNVQVSVGERSACASVTLDKFASDVSFGWGAMQLNVLDTSRSDARFLSLQVEENFIGGDCSSPAATQPACSKANLPVTICFLTDNADVSVGAEAVGDAVTKIFSDQIAFPLKLSGSINDRRNQGGASSVSAGFTLPAKAFDTLFGDSSGGSSASNGPEFKGVELESLQNGVIGLTARLGLSFGETDTSVSLPALAFGVVDCTDAANKKLLAVVETTASNLVIAPASANKLSAFSTLIGFDGVNAEDLLKVGSRVLNNDKVVKACVTRHPVAAKRNFLSTLLSSFEVGFDAADGTGSGTGSGGSDSTTSVIDVTSNERSACFEIDLAVDQLTLETELGWGAVQLTVSDATSGEQFLSLNMEEAFLGAGCDSPFATPSSCGKKTIKVGICVATANPDAVAGADAVGRIVEKLFVDQLAFSVTLSGQIANRRNQQVKSISASFEIPAKALDMVQGSETTSDSSSSFSPKSLHFEVDRLRSDKVELSSAFILEFGGSKVKLTAPTIHVGVAECTGTTKTHLVSVVAQAASGSLGLPATSDFTEVGLSIGFEESNAQTVLEVASKWLNSETSKVCVTRHPTSSLGNFLSKLIASFQFEFDVTSGASSSLPGSKLDLTVVSDDRSACTSIDVDVSGSDLTFSAGWGQQSLFVSELGSSFRFGSLSVPEAFIGAGCDSQFATTSSCGKSKVAVTICLETNDSDTNRGADQVRTLVEKIAIDQLETSVVLSGSSANRRSPQSGTSPISAQFVIPADAFDTLQGSAQSGSGGGFALGDLVESLTFAEFVGTTAKIDVKGKSDTGVFDSISLTVPPIRIMVSTESESKTAEVGTLLISLPPKATKFETTVSFSLVNWARVFETVILFRDKEDASIKVGRVSSPTNFLDRMIPTYVLVEPTGSAPSPSTSPVADFRLEAVSTDSKVDLRINFQIFEEVSSVPFIWPAETIRIRDGANNAVGQLSLPASSIGPAASSISNAVFTLQGSAAPALATNLFKGNDIGLQLESVSSSRWDVGFVIPKDVVKALALGTDDSASGLSDSIFLKELTVLGGNSMGSDIVLPCLVSNLCNNLLIDEASVAYSAITIGMLFTLPDLSADRSISFSIDLQSTLTLDVGGNGQLMGTLTLQPFKLDSSNTGPSKPLQAILTFKWNSDELENLRFIINRVSTAEDLVLSLSGSIASGSNFASRLLQGIEQDILYESKAADPNAPPLVGETELGLVDAKPKQLRAFAAADVSYLNGPDDLNVLVPLGQVKANVYYDNQLVASANVDANQPDGVSFFLEPKPTKQRMRVVATAFRDTGSGPVTRAMNGLFQRFVFSEDIKMRAVAEIVPPQSASMFNSACSSSNVETRRTANCGFKLETWLTYPKVDEISEFIDDFQVKLSASIFQSIGDAKVLADKIVYNSLPFDVIISHYSYKVVMYDTDGTIIEPACHRGIISGNPTSCRDAWFFDLCYEPYKTAARKENIIQTPNGSADVRPQIGRVSEGDVRTPAKSLLADNQKFLPSKGTGKSEMTINPILEDLGRMWDEFNDKQMFCADITEGRMVVGIQTPGTTCNDDNRDVDSLQCTFVMDLSFNLPNFALTDGDSCRGPKNAQEDLNNPVTLDSGFSWGPPSALSSAGSLNGKRVQWTQSTVSLLDPFELELQVRYASGRDDRIEIVFGASKTSTTSIYINSEGCNSAGVTGAVSKTLAAVHSLEAGSTASIRITYDAYTSRVRIAVTHTKKFEDEVSSGPYLEYSDFDFLPIKALGTNRGFIGVMHDSSKSTIVAANMRNPNTDSSRATFVDKAGTNNIIPKVGEMGYFTFQSRDQQGRRRGSGGESWSVTAKNADTGSTSFVRNQVTESAVRSGPCQAAASVSCSTTTRTCVCDMGDGTYRLAFNFQDRGRYEFAVASSTARVNTNEQSFLTEKVFVRN